MRLAQLRLLFDAGDLMGAEIATAPMEPGPSERWVLQLRRRNGTREPLELDRRAPNGNALPRVFSSLDGAYRAARKIGFREAKIISQ